MKKRKKIPKFKSEKEKADFWSTHSPLDYAGEFREAKKPFQFDVAFLKKMAKKHKEKKKTLTLRMEESQILLAKIIANRLGDYYQALIRVWVREGIIRELKEHPEIEEHIRKKQLHLLT
ncbi:CopG family antitoxin [Candidatus Omnitrophota bacterium]